MAERLAREYEASLDVPSITNKQPAMTNVSTTGPATPTTYDGLPETEVFKDSVYFRLEKLGFRVGLGLSERFSRDRPRLTDNLDVIKFLCKDIWTIVFKKQIDNLKTNHRVSPSSSIRVHVLTVGRASTSLLTTSSVHFQE